MKDPRTFIDAVTRAFRNMRTEQAIDSACQQTCFDDGNDVGGGTFNVYLYTEDIPATVRLLTNLEKADVIPPGLRVGVGQYRDKQRRDWTYKVAYPNGLKSFDLTYRNSK